ncbi:MAG: imidazole glycerol phosphate synthase subunit HisH [Actinomycetes bacterium]
MTNVVVLDYGSGNVRSVQRALETTGASVEVTVDFETALNADALVVPGVGAFAACVEGIRKVRGDQIIGRRLAGGRPVLGICVGMQVLFERSTEHAGDGYFAGLNEWPGTIDTLHAPVLPHMGWNTVIAPSTSEMFAGISDERFYFVHSFAARTWELDPIEKITAPKVTWANHGEDFVAAVENGPLWATQFHPEKSGEAGLTLLANWISTVK